MSKAYQTIQELQKQLGTQLQSLRISRATSQSELAAKSLVSVRAIQKLEAGKGSTVETLLRYLKGLDATSFIDLIAPKPTVSPIALLKTGHMPRRVRKAAKPEEGTK